VPGNDCIHVSMSVRVKNGPDSPRNATSGLPRSSDIIRPARLVRFVPAEDTLWGQKGAASPTVSSAQ
jgi:hypothetical protein